MGSANGGEPWGLEPVEPGPPEGRFLLRVLAEVIERADGAAVSLTVVESRWIAAIHRVAPDLHPWLAYRLARLYARREADGKPWEDLDAWLAFAPWKGKEQQARYLAAATRGWPHPAPIEAFVRPPYYTPVKIAAARRLLEESKRPDESPAFEGVLDDAARMQLEDARAVLAELESSLSHPLFHFAPRVSGVVKEDDGSARAEPRARR